MTRIISIEAFLQNDGPSAAEIQLVAACRAGEACELAETRPTAVTPDNRIRAALIRCLLLGGTPQCGLHESGVWLEGAWITGQLDLRHVTGRGQLRLLFCHLEKKPLLGYAQLDHLNLGGSKLPGLSAPHLRVKGSVVLRRVEVAGTVAVDGARIGGQLDCTGAKLDGAGGKAFNGQRVKVGESLFLSHVTARGTVTVSGADVSGHLACDGSELDGAGGKAFNAQGLKVGESLFLRGVTARGTVDVNGAQIGGQLTCDGAKLDGAGGAAFHGPGLKLGESLFLRGVTARGAVDVSGADVRGQLACDGSELDGAGGRAFHAQALKLGDSLFLTDVTAHGTVALTGAQVGGQLTCAGAKLDGAGGKAFHGQGLQVTSGFFFRRIAGIIGDVSLASARVGVLADDFTSWHLTSGRLDLAGFRYDRFAGASLDVSKRLHWLARGARFGGTLSPQPYTQLAQTYAAAGHKREARRVLFERELLMGQQERLADYKRADGRYFFPLENLWADAKYVGRWAVDRLFSWGAGYGYQPQRAVVWLLVLWATAAGLAQWAWRDGDFAPNSAVILVSPGWAEKLGEENPAEAWSSPGAAGQDWDTFQCIAWALDLVVPILDIGQTDAWQPSRDRGTAGHLLWWARWYFESLGWLVSALLVAAITGIMQKDRE